MPELGTCPPCKGTGVVKSITFTENPVTGEYNIKADFKYPCESCRGTGWISVFQR